MASRRVTDSKAKLTRRRPATTPQSREDELIALAIDTAEKQMREGTASAPIINHFLRLGSSRERLEQERLAMEVQLMEAKRESIESAQRMETLYGEALAAMRGYQGQSDSEEDYYDD